jgi:hypothetical protein
MQRNLILILILLPGLTAACGGSSDSTAPEVARMTGTVVELDGQTLDRSNVAVTVLETGATAVTGPDGRFVFGRIPTGRITLQFENATRRPAQNSDDDSHDSDDDSHDSDDESHDSDDDEDEDEEDDDSRVRVTGITAGEVVEIRCSFNDGVVSSVSRSSDAGIDAEIKVESAGLKLEVEVESGHDGEEFEVELEGLAPGQTIGIRVEGLIEAVLQADSDGEIEFEVNTGLPAGGVAALAGKTLTITDEATGDELFAIEIPALPSAGSREDDGSDVGGRSSGRARLDSFDPPVEGYVEIRRDLDDGEQRFKMDAENLAPGSLVTFLIENPDTGAFDALATVAADAEGEAEINTQDGLPMPLGVDDVSALIGLGVRVTPADESETVLLAGEVPPLVAD